MFAVWASSSVYVMCLGLQPLGVFLKKYNHADLSFSPGVGFWDFASSVYAKPDMQQQLLAFQDEYHANVNIILWCFWLDVENLQISADCLDEVLMTVDAVSMQTVAKLRDVRRLIAGSEFFTKAQTSSIKRHILTAELMVEKILIHRLQMMTHQFVDASRKQRYSPDFVLLDLGYYLEFIEVPNARRKASLMLNACRSHAFELRQA